MNKKLKIPPKPSKLETEKLDNFIRMQDWHFETLILPHCTQVEAAYLGWTKSNGESESVKAFIYGLKAIITDSQTSCIANFFIRSSYRVYQTYSIKEACEIIELLEKEFKFDEYKRKLWRTKFKERQKLISIKNKTKVKKIKTPIKKVA